VIFPLVDKAFRHFIDLLTRSFTHRIEHMFDGKPFSDLPIGELVDANAEESGQIAAAQRDDSKLRIAAPLDDRLRHKLCRRFVLLQKPVDHFLVFIRRFGVPPQLVVPRAARKERSLGMHARQSARRHKILVLVGVALELGNLFEFIRA